MDTKSNKLLLGVVSMVVGTICFALEKEVAGAAFIIVGGMYFNS